MDACFLCLLLGGLATGASIPTSSGTVAPGATAHPPPLPALPPAETNSHYVSGPNLDELALQAALQKSVQETQRTEKPAPPMPEPVQPQQTNQQQSKFNIIKTRVLD